jgi:DGQHR domain-containing protein
VTSGRCTSVVLARRALRITQGAGAPLYMFSLTAGEILQVAAIFQDSRHDLRELIGCQLPEACRHLQEITDYVDSDQQLMPNAIIMALPSTVRFACSRGPGAGDGIAISGVLKIPLMGADGSKSGWIVRGQERALAIAAAKGHDFPVPVNAFVADSVDVQRDQFLRLQNARLLAPELTNQLLHAVNKPLPPYLSLQQIPPVLCALLNTDDDSPFHNLIKGQPVSSHQRKKAIVSDDSIIQALTESLTSPSGCLFSYRSLSGGKANLSGMWTVLMLYWNAVKETFPVAWGRPPSQSRLMHGAGIRAMGRLMDHIMARVNVAQPEAQQGLRADLTTIAPYCHWTDGTWERLGLRWNEVQNVPRHIHELSGFLIRTYLQEQAARR